MRLIITGVASTCTLPLPTRGAVCSSPTRNSALPVIPALSLPSSTNTMVAALQQGAGISELDFTRHFSAGHPVPEPDHNAEALRRIDALGMIGEASLKTSGFYARVVSAERRTRPRTPGETVVLIVEDDQTTGAVIEAVLQKFGYRTRHARNRAEIGTALAAKPMPGLGPRAGPRPDV